MLDFKKKSKNLISFKNQKNAELNESQLKILIERWFNANLKLICNVCEHLVTNKTSIGGGVHSITDTSNRYQGSFNIIWFMGLVVKVLVVVVYYHQ